MRIGQIGKENYAQFVKMFNPNAKNAKALGFGDDGSAKNAVDSFNPEKMANTHGVKGMYIGGGKDWRRIIPVSDEVKQKLQDVVKADFIATNGESIPEGSKRNDVIVKYLKTLSQENTAAAAWTLGRMAGEYATKLESLLKQSTPGWKPGDAFNTKILDKLDGSFGGLNVKV